MGTIYRGDWPRPPSDRPPFYDERSFPAGIPVLSFSGEIRGITLARGAPCPSRTCDGFLICVDWESGQLTFPCTHGWDWDGPDRRAIAITAGGEITGRVINPVAPLPRDQWPARTLTIPHLRWPLI